VSSVEAAFGPRGTGVGAGACGSLSSEAAAPGGGGSHCIGNPAKARTVLGWAPTVDFKGLVAMMVDADIARLKQLPTASSGIVER